MEANQFVDLNVLNVLFLFWVGFVGGMVSGFIGSGGAFVLTPAMMSMGVSGVVAVASNMCNKFPKALIGAYRRYQYGQVDLKLGAIMALGGSLGVWFGADIQHRVHDTYGAAGSNLYVSIAFVVVLLIVGSFVMYDVWRILRSGDKHAEHEPVGKLARRLQAIEIPGTMITFKTAKLRVSLLFILPIGIATGMLAATIAVGGFIGVPGMVYLLGASSLVASASELVVAFVMGLGGTIKYSLHGLVDIRLAMILLAGSLFGVQLGAIGTTYVKPYTIKLVMGSIMLIVAVSRAMVIPVYLRDLDVMEFSAGVAGFLRGASFGFMVMALVIGAAIIVGAMIRGHRRARVNVAVPEQAAE